MARREADYRGRGGSSRPRGVCNYRLIAILGLIVAVVAVAIFLTQSGLINTSSGAGASGTNGTATGSTNGDSSNNNNSNGNTDDASDDPPSAAPALSGDLSDGEIRCNGLASLCDIRVNEIQFATLHNAVSDGESSVWPNHDLPLEQALEAGWRGLNYDVGVCEGELRMVHGVCDLGTRDPVTVWMNIVDFLQANKQEVILMPVEIVQDLGGQVTLEALYETMLQVNGWVDLLYTHDSTQPWPTLRTLIEADTRIVFFHYNGDSCRRLGSDCPSEALHDWFDYAVETNFQFSSVEELKDTEYACEVTRGLSGTRNFFGVNVFLTLAGTACDEVNAEDFLRGHLEACTTSTGMLPNAVILDCWDNGGALEVIQANNEQLQAAVVVDADITMVLEGVSTAMDADGERTFQRRCGMYFANSLESFENVSCNVVSQQRVGERQRRLQVTALQVEVKVLGDSIGNTSFTSESLEAIVNESGETFAASLSNADDAFADITALTFVTADSAVTDAPSVLTTTPSSLAPTSITTSPTSIPASPTSSNVSTAPTRESIDTQVPVVAVVTAAPMVTTTELNTTLGDDATSTEFLSPTVTPATTVVDAVPATDATITTKTPATVAPTVVVPQGAVTSRSCNGHGNLCDVSVNDILFATMHNAASTVEDGVVLFSNHELGLGAALEAGYRGINLDIGKCDGEIVLVHGFCELGIQNITTVFSTIVSFLRENPDEVLILPTQLNYDTGGSFSLDEIDSIFQSVAGLKNLFYMHDGSTDWPTLQELIDAGTRILFFHFNGEQCNDNQLDSSCPTGFHDWFRYAAESQFEFNTLAAFEDKVYACEITRGGSGSRSFYGVNVFPRVPNVAVCGAMNLRASLEAHLAQCAALTGESVNLLIVDCWHDGNVLDVVREYNDQLG